MVSNYQTTLSSPMNSSQLTINVNSIVTRDATPVTLTTALMGTGWYLTIDPSTSSEEFVKITAVTPGAGVSGTFTVDAAGRGLAYSGNTDAQGTGNAKSHNPGAIVILSNAKNVYDRLVDRESDETIDGTKTFLDLPQIPLATSGQLSSAASVQYVNETAVAGAPNAAVGTKGIVEIGTQTQVNEGDDTGLTNATSVVIPSTHLQTWDQLVTTDFTYGETIAVKDCVWLDTTTGRWEKAGATDVFESLFAFGFALDAGNNGDTGKRVQIGGIVTGLAGLNQTEFVYLSNTDGQVSVTPGDNKKVIGVATSASSLMIYPILDVAALFDVNSNVTSETLNLAADFFDSPFHQGLKTNYTTGQALAAGEVVALESDGFIYRTRPKGFSTSNAGTATTMASTELGSQGKMYWFTTATPTIKTFLGVDEDTAKHFTMIRTTVDSNFNAISSTALDDESPGALGDTWDAIQHSSNTQVTIAYADGADMSAISCDTLTGTPVFGSPIVLETNTIPGAICDTSVSNTLIAFGGANSQADLKSFKMTFVGTALTESTNANLFVGGSSLNPYAAGRFTGTDFVAVLYRSGASGFVIIGQYDPAAGTWTTAGTPIVVGSTNTGAGFMVPLSSTKMALCFIDATDLKAYVITRSAVTATLSSGIVAVPSISATILTNAVSFSRIGKYSFLASAETSAGGKVQLISLDRDFTDFATVGSAFTNDSATNRGIVGTLLTPQRWLAAYRSAATVSSLITRELTSNLDAAVGVVDAAVASSATEDVTTRGWSEAFTGLTPGTAYYTDLDGQLTTSSNGVTPLPSNNAQSPLTRRAVVAQSTTAGQIDL